MQNNYEGSNAKATNINTNNNNCVVNYAAEWLDALNEIKRLNEDIKGLYETMLKNKDAMIEELKKINRS